MSTSDEFLRVAKTTMRDAAKMKAAMIKKELFIAKAKCPECEGYLMATRARSNGHIWMKCSGSCKRSMME